MCIHTQQEEGEEACTHTQVQLSKQLGKQSMLARLRDKVQDESV